MNAHYLIPRRCGFRFHEPPHRNEGVAVIFSWKLSCIIKRHLHRGRMRCIPQRHRNVRLRQFRFLKPSWRIQVRIGLIVTVEIRPTVEYSYFDMVQLFGLQIIA